jgi:hypothetical protein
MTEKKKQDAIEELYNDLAKFMKEHGYKEDGCAVQPLPREKRKAAAHFTVMITMPFSGIFGIGAFLPSSKVSVRPRRTRKVRRANVTPLKEPKP